MKASMTKAQMDSSIKKNSGTKRALLSIPGVVLGKSTGKLIEDCIGKRTVGKKLTSFIKKK
jgi:hypothetical protein